MGRGGHIEAALRKNVPLPTPVVGRGIAFDGRKDGQVRTMAATDFPAFAVERMRAVTAQKPGIMQMKNDGDLVAEPRKAAQVEITPMQVVTMDNIRSVGG
jgi:hypothetical protein